MCQYWHKTRQVGASSDSARLEQMARAGTGCGGQAAGKTEGVHTVGRSKLATRAAQPEMVLRAVFRTGLDEIIRAGISVRAGNTGTSLVVAIDAWRLCTSCGLIRRTDEMANTEVCQNCAGSASTGTGEANE